MDSQCLMVNCRNLAPDNEAFCAKHRDTRMRKLEDIPHDDLSPDDYTETCPKCGGSGTVDYDPADEIEGWME